MLNECKSKKKSNTVHKDIIYSIMYNSFILAYSFEIDDLNIKTYFWYSLEERQIQPNSHTSLLGRNKNILCDIMGIKWKIIIQINNRHKSTNTCFQ